MSVFSILYYLLVWPVITVLTLPYYLPTLAMPLYLAGVLSVGLYVFIIAVSSTGSEAEGTIVEHSGWAGSCSDHQRLLGSGFVCAAQRDEVFLMFSAQLLVFILCRAHDPEAICAALSASCFPHSITLWLCL